MKHLWFIIAFLFIVFACTTDMSELSFTVTPKNIPQDDKGMEDLKNNTEIKSPNNSTSATDWLMHNKKKAAIGLIIGVTIAVIIIVIICCCCTKVASEKIKRKKKKKGGVLRGLRKFLMPKFKMPKLKMFSVQPKKDLQKEIKDIGSLTFSLFYEKRTAELLINIKKADDLSLKSSSEVSFNFVQIQLDPFTLAGETMGQYYETTRVRNSVSPNFDDVMIIKILPRELEDQTLNCFVFDENRISQRDLIGVASVKLKDVYKSIYGKEKDFNEILKWRTGEKGGDILLGLHWNPRNEIFYVTIKECMNLSMINTPGEPNAYVKIEVFDSSQRVFKETTNTKSRTSFPVFNERFMFNFTNEQKKRTCLIVSVKHNPGLFGKKYLIGQLSFSFSAIGEELSHWKSTLSGGNDVEMMHSLHPAVQVPRKQKKAKEIEGIIDILTDEENLSENEEDRLL